MNSDIAREWVSAELDIITGAQPNSPTYASRSLAYLGLTMYECVVQGGQSYQSIAGQLDGLKAMPEAGGLDWEVALSAGQRKMVSYLYPSVSDGNKNRMKRIHDTLLKGKEGQVSQTTLDLSARFGEEVADRIIKWAKKDGGDKKYHKVLDTEYPLPTGPEYWVPPFGGQFSEPGTMHPYWADNRRFVKENRNVPVDNPLAYSLDSSSTYYKEMKLVYTHNISLSQEEKEMAAWWGDDPTVTPSPPGHSMYLASVLTAQNQSDLIETAAVFAMVGMATADAFMEAWRAKYTWHTQRPTAYIRGMIAADYWQYWPEPPFPAYVSGHSSQIAAAVTVLQSVYGDNQMVTDEFHKWRQYDVVHEVGFNHPRHFTSLWDLAEECGWSRILGGIHMPQDNIAGLKLGRDVGNNVARLNWRP